MRPIFLDVIPCHVRRVCLLLACILVAAPGAVAQQATAPAKKSTAPDETPKMQLRVYPLRYTDAKSLQSVIAQAVDQGRGGSEAVAADARTNSLVVRATTEDLVTIEQLVKQLDVPAPDREPGEALEMKVFKVRNLTLSTAVMQQLQIAVSNQGRVAIDASRNFVVVHDTREALARFEALLNTLDNEVGPAKPAMEGLRVRVVWLINGMERKDAAPAPGDLKGVLADLAKIGVEGLQVAAQTFVQTVPNDDFQLECSPELDNPCGLSISGRFVNAPDGLNTLQLRISAQETNHADGSHRQLCNIRTTILAPAGRIVVLGATPVSKMTSVFAVQVMSE